MGHFLGLWVGICLSFQNYVGIQNQGLEESSQMLTREHFTGS